MPSKLDLGAGNFQAEGKEWVTLDIVSTFRPNVLGSAYALPFADDSLSAVKCHHVLEHIPRDYFVFHWRGEESYIEARHGLIDVMNEIWRVVKPGGEVWIEVPRFPSEEAIADPTHGSFLVMDTFNYFFRCDAHDPTDEVHQYTCREDHRQMYGIKPWKKKQAEHMNHARIIGVIAEKVTE